MDDFDRPLAEEGEREARKIGKAMESAGFIPDMAICSAAKRTRETLEHLRPALTAPFPAIDSRELYSADAEEYLEIIRAVEPPTSSLLVIGHNPSIAELALMLSTRGDPLAIERLSQGYPTAALAVIDFHAPLAQAEEGEGTLRAFITPEDIADI
ncbi:phosphoglycerate mutase [Brucella endophytica]|uniref:Phosphoglycerate mutase n=2 Tax=Brucella endophytica TaxID=1963359 RepID=A0A916S726_9HYPH|nr:phosphoglycerate mutase [Brucella endophytica]